MAIFFYINFYLKEVLYEWTS